MPSLVLVAERTAGLISLAIELYRQRTFWPLHGQVSLRSLLKPCQEALPAVPRVSGLGLCCLVLCRWPPLPQLLCPCSKMQETFELVLARELKL